MNEWKKIISCWKNIIVEYLRQNFQFDFWKRTTTFFVLTINRILTRIVENVDNLIFFQQNRVNNFETKLNYENVNNLNFFFSSFQNSTQNKIENVFFLKFWFVMTNHFKLKIYFSSFLKWFADENEIIFRVAMTLSKMIVLKFLSRTIENSKTCFWTMQISNLLNFLK